MKIKSLIFTAVLATALFCSGGIISAQAIDNSALIAQLQAQIASLIAQIKTLQTNQAANTGTGTWCHDFNSDFGISNGINSGISLDDAGGLVNIFAKENLQTLGETTGALGVLAGDTPKLTDNVAALIIKIQQKYGIRASGWVGPVTRAKLNSLYGCSGVALTSSTSPQITQPPVIPYITQDNVDARRAQYAEALSISQQKAITSTDSNNALNSLRLLNVQMDWGGGVITGPGINCIGGLPGGLSDLNSNVCAKRFADGETVTLTATPIVESGSIYVFDRWMGECVDSKQATCTFVMNSDKHVQGMFYRTAGPDKTITITKPVGGYIYSSYPDMTIMCGDGHSSGPDICTATYKWSVYSHTGFLLDARPAPGYKFDSWIGNCPLYDPSFRDICMPSFDADNKVTVSARFVPINITNGYELRVAIAGTGKGTISGQGIKCGSGYGLSSGGTDCSEFVQFGGYADVVSSADLNSNFDGWTGDCTAAFSHSNIYGGDCYIKTMNSNKSVTANFSSKAILSGVCGTANGVTVSVTPTTNLCSVGTSTTPTGSGPWTWTCAGSNGGTTASCSANKTTTTMPSITVISPNGGESWEQGTTHTITWSSVNLPSDKTMSVQLIGSNGSSLIAQNILTSANSYSWQIPKQSMTAFIVPASSYKIFVGFDVESDGPHDYSDNYFTISPATTAVGVTQNNLASISDALAKIMAQVQVLLKK